MLTNLQDWQYYNFINRKALFASYLQTKYPGTIVWDAAKEAAQTKRFAVQNGVFTPTLDIDLTGATPAQPFGGNIPWSELYDGINDYGLIPATALDLVFDGNNFTAGVFMQPSAASVWENDTHRQWLTMRVDANNLIYLRKTFANRINALYATSGPTSLSVNKTGVSGDARQFVCATVTGGVLSLFVNGVFVDSVAGGGTFTGNFNPANTVIGSFAAPASSVWDGPLATVFIHPIRAMTPTEIAEIGARSGVY